MSEQESIPPKDDPSAEELIRFFEGIETVAVSQVSEVAQPDNLSKKEQTLYLEGKKETLFQAKRVNKTRLFLLKALFSIIVLWIGSVVTITLFAGFKFRDFQLSEKVLITYITTTTATVFGLFYVGAKWLFSKDT